MGKGMEDWFSKQDFDLEKLPEGHRTRFMDRLDSICAEQDSLEEDTAIALRVEHRQNQKIRTLNTTTIIKWSLVAGLAILMGLTVFNMGATPETDLELSSVSPEMAQAQDFFKRTIDAELERLNKEQSPETERIIADTKAALDKLETDYQSIKKDFQVNQDSKAVIAAMITNFQMRIDLLETALEQIEQLKTYKENENEIFI
ncbi:hypothetical protein [Nonlabens xiamenensis]|uniref:hypothetical protein n=1 Tax=Nonlabens xiamenensis TaxID=2341043 RepID=UPI000F6064EC|nr:hypothetical protein [Nonlabens xiamenensis]